LSQSEVDNRDRPAFTALLLADGGVWATLVLLPLVVVAPFISFSGLGATVAAGILLTILVVLLSLRARHLYVLARRGVLSRGRLVEVKNVGSDTDAEWQAKYSYEYGGQSFTISATRSSSSAARQEVRVLIDPKHPKSATILGRFLSSRLYLSKRSAGNDRTKWPPE
jgi:hypothetical protein